MIDIPDVSSGENSDIRQISISIRVMMEQKLERERLLGRDFPTLLHLRGDGVKWLWRTLDSQFKQYCIVNIHRISEVDNEILAKSITQFFQAFLQTK